MGLNNAARGYQADAVPFTFCCKSLHKKLYSFLFGNARTVIVYFYPDHVLTIGERTQSPDSDCLFRFTVMQRVAGVGKQIHQKLLQFGRVGINDRQLGR